MGNQKKDYFTKSEYILIVSAVVAGGVLILLGSLSIEVLALGIVLICLGAGLLLGGIFFIVIRISKAYQRKGL